MLNVGRGERIFDSWTNMKITKITAGGLVTLTGTVSGDYTVIITDSLNGKNPFVFPQTSFPVDVSALVENYNRLKGQRVKIEIASQSNSHEYDEVEFVAGTEWLAPTDPDDNIDDDAEDDENPLLIVKIWRGIIGFLKRHSRKIWIMISLMLVVVFLISMWLFIDPVSRYKNYKKSRVITDESVTSSSTNPSVADVADKIRSSDTTTSELKVTEPQSAILLTNTISGLKGGVNIVSTGHGTTNIIIVVGRDYKVGGSGSDKPEWPEGYKPNRREVLTPDENLKIGDKEDQIFTIAPREDIAFILPGNWRVETYPDRTFLHEEYQSSVDGDVKEGFGKLQDGRVIRYRNLSARPMKLGIRCIKNHTKATDSIWDGIRN